ncbi:MAG: hypothetical protein AUK48_02160 [Oscillatoriales cyanobacterium CG2_30_44_21]|nr:MAG: hypothetical protein AUK48_02160 [Oscillatoriales cyanobacterium CG2_30_44_21]
MESLESILEQLQNQYKPSTSPIVDDLNGKLARLSVVENKVEIVEMPISSTSNSLDNLLNDLRKSNHPVAEVPSISSSAAIARDLQEVSHQQKAKDHARLEKLAEEWLAKLDPLCGEGLWFEEFAKNYSSRLEAAIALIQSE